MKKIIKLTENDLARIVKRVISEMETGTDPQDPAHHFDTVEKALIPKGFKRNASMLKPMGVLDLNNGSGHGGIIVRYYSPAHPESKKKGYVVELIVNNASKKKWGQGANMYEVIKEVEKYLKPQGVNESRMVKRLLNEGMGPGNFKVGQVFDEVHNRQYIMSLNYSAAGRGSDDVYNDFEFVSPKVVSVDKDGITLKITSGYYDSSDTHNQASKYVNLSDFCLVVPYSNIQEVRENQLMISTVNSMVQYRVDKGCTAYKAKLAEKTAKAKKCGHASWEAYKKSNWACGGR